jgi:hypothetical protein
MTLNVSARFLALLKSPNTVNTFDHKLSGLMPPSARETPASKLSLISRTCKNKANGEPVSLALAEPTIPMK